MTHALVCETCLSLFTLFLSVQPDTLRLWAEREAYISGVD